MAPIPLFQMLRTIVAGRRPTGRYYGEPYVNFADMQFGVFDSGNNPRDLLGFPIFSPSASYAAGTGASYLGVPYIALVAVSPGTWNAGQWSPVASQAFAEQIRPNFFTGGRISNSTTAQTTTVNVAPWVGSDQANSVTMILPAAWSKTTAAWAAGNGNGAMGPGLAVAASTWYHIYAAMVAGVIDIFFDTTLPPTHLPTGVTAWRRLMSIKTDSSSHLLPFNMVDREVLWSNGPYLDYSGGYQSGLSVALASIPPGLRVRGQFDVMITNTTTAVTGAASPGETSSGWNIWTAAYATVSGMWNGGNYWLRTNKTQQIRQSISTYPNSNSNIYTYGWIDPTGTEAYA